MRRFSEALIERIGVERARGVIIDVAALDVLDSYGAHTLGAIAEVARLRGAETVVVGVSPEIAFTMVRLGMSIAHVHTALDLEQGLQVLGQLTARRP
jgi:rsbT antagonist protein RsbS